MTIRARGFRSLMAAALLCGGLAAAAPAEEDGATERADDVAAIRARVAEFVAALEQGDPERVAAFWTEGGEYTGGDGVPIEGRDKLKEAYSRLFAEIEGLTVSMEIDSVKFLSRDTAIVSGTFEAQRKKEREPRSSGFSLLCVREGGPWSIAVLRERARTPALRDLEWLIGDWAAKTEGGEVRTSYHWDESKKFIMMRFSIQGEDRALTGFEVIGIDPATGGIRSWIFEGEGDVGTGIWEREGNRWVISASSVLSDRTTTTATNVLTPVNRDTFRWESRDRVDHGEELPAIEPITVTRRPASEGPRN